MSARSDRPQALLLNLDDTLLDSSVIPGFIRRTCELVADAYPTSDAAELFEANTSAWTEYWSQVEKECWLGGLDVATVSREAWRRTLYACGSDDASVVEFAFERSQQLDRETRRPFPDVVDLLRCAESLDLPLALVTNGPSGLQRDRLQSLGMDDVFDAVVVSAEVGVAKPDAEPFLLAVERLGVGPSEAWHAGDSLETDVAGARAAGLTAVWVNRAGRTREPADPSPDLEVSSLAELAVLLRGRSSG